MWTFNAFDWDGNPVRRLGINLGAPGDRLADGGTLWLDWPSRGGPSPDVPVEVKGDKLDYFCYHASHVHAEPARGELPWVAASGVIGARQITITLAKNERPRRYTVRLHFAEVDERLPGARVFRIKLQGKPVVDNLDVLKRAGGARRALVGEFSNVEVAGKLTVSLDPPTDGPEPILCGIEVVAEEDWAAASTAVEP
jgi:hypothetical protein